ncbi:unnamed protein product [Polarella glacialis]|uniref:Uncharacterized protein n=1 Tax=Polarella glacialis TaxID=89957 RepID=A0A813GKQ6_POLGL|nr:unnamed protein product [Polarella glacialis]
MDTTSDTVKQPILLGPEAMEVDAVRQGLIPSKSLGGSLARRNSFVEKSILKTVEVEAKQLESRLRPDITLITKDVRCKLFDRPGLEGVDSFLEDCRREVRNGLGDLDDNKADGTMGATYFMEGVPSMDTSAEDDNGHKIGELASTAICGNDITASCFYVVGELSRNAGVYAPLCTMLSSATLYCFRSVYAEVVTALPLNGGIYNLLLNSSTKQAASVAACLTILSYTATGVVSSVSAADYLKCSPMFGDIESVPTAIGILGFFAMLMLMGMQESSAVASLLFLFHLSTLFILAVFSVFFLQDEGLGQLYANFAWEKQPPFANSIFFGFSSAMLGVSGFETSANFVEEQKPGVFPKTLTNMWVSVSVINIFLPSLAIAVIPLDDLTGSKAAYALAVLAERVGGPLLRDIVAIDALLVLSGSVLTSYVGVVGLFQRMAGDRCLPEFFSETNSWRGTPHYTILVFFAVCSSMCIVLDGDISALAAIYSISFLLVMGLFAFCGLWMKINRPTLPRPIESHPMFFVIGLLLVAFAFTAVVLLHPEMLTYFYVYYGITTLMVMLTFARENIFTAFLTLLSHSKVAGAAIKCIMHKDVAEMWIRTKLKTLRNQGVVYFTKSASISQINRAVQYIEQNEEARWLKVIHAYTEDEPIPPNLLEYVQMLDCVYPKIKIDCIVVRGEFSPELVQYISTRLSVPVNSMFINCPKHNFKHSLDRMGGVRVILNSEKASLLEGVSGPTPQGPSPLTPSLGNSYPEGHQLGSV